MTENQAMEPFETRFARRVRTYTDPATERRIDPLAISRTAMSSHSAPSWWRRRLGAGLLGWRVAGGRWAVASVAVLLIGVVGIAISGRSSDSGIGLQPTSAAPSTPATASSLNAAASAGGPVPDALRHSWQRPLPITPGGDPWGTGFLILASGRIDFGVEPGPGASASSGTAGGPDTIVATATVETQGCAIGDIGTYSWLLEGKDSVLTLTAIGPDVCATREEALAGQWVRSDFPGGPGEGATLEPGTHETSSFDPFGDPARSGQLSFTVPAGWKVKEDQPGSLLLHHLVDASPTRPASDSFIAVFAQPRMSADFTNGAPCGPVGTAPGVGHGVNDMVAAIAARPGVVSTTPAAVTIGHFEGQMLGLQLAPSWTGGCVAPEGPVVAMPVLVDTRSEPGPVIAISRDHPVRVILLDITEGRTLAITIFSDEPTQPSAFGALVADVMPVVESFEFHPGTP